LEKHLKLYPEWIAKLLETNIPLTSLGWYGDKYSAEEVKRIAKALETNKTLTTLWLGHNKFGEEIAKIFETNKTLTTLWLGNKYVRGPKY